MKTVFLSSTSIDLVDYRKAAIDVCMRLGLHPIAMEYFNAQSRGATESSKRELDNADLYVGFFAHRYGYIEDGYTSSVTEIEFDYAGERALDRICFIIDPVFPWPETAMDYENNTKLVAFKNKVNKLVRGQFTSVDNFAMLLTTALVEWMGGIQVRSKDNIDIPSTYSDKLGEKPKILSKSHVFISYSKKNRTYARSLANHLVSLGFDIWIDDRIDYGDDWWRTIFRAIVNARAFIVIMTDDSDSSQWVQREVTIADKNKIPCFPLWLSGDFQTSENWSIFVRTQYADVRDGKLPHDDFYIRLEQVAPRKSITGINITPPSATSDVAYWPKVLHNVKWYVVFAVGAIIVISLVLVFSFLNRSPISNPTTTPIPTSSSLPTNTKVSTPKPTNTVIPAVSPTNTLPLEKADLVVSSIAGPTTTTVGASPVTYSITITNVGSGRSGVFKSTVRLPNGRDADLGVVSNLNAGESISLNIDISFTTPMSYTMLVTVDSDNQVDEISNENNTATLNIRVS
jgi:hypothetical protein